jgi:hypothetical protein
LPAPPTPAPEKQKSTVTPIPWFLGGFITLEQIGTTVATTVSTTVLGALSILTVLLNGDTRPGKMQYGEHNSNKSPSNRNKHQEGKARKKQDRYGSKGEKLPPRKRPKDWRGSYPPKEWPPRQKP